MFLQFKLTQQKNDPVNFLGLFINRNTQELKLKIYWKPTSTDYTIYSSSNYTMEQKLAAYSYLKSRMNVLSLNLLKPTGHVMHQQFNIQQLYALPTLYLSENKQRLVPLTS